MPTRRPRRTVLGRGLLAAGAAAAAALAGYAVFVEPRRLERTHPRIHIRGLPRDLEGFRIALLTDLHAGRLTPPSVLRRAVRTAMDAQPHLIAITGDLLDRRRQDMARALRALNGIAAPLGVYAVPGNHDHVSIGLADWRQAIAAHASIIDLTNHSVTMQVGEAMLCVAGVDDLEEGEPELVLPPPAARDVTILLAHQPDQGERTRRAVDQVDLVLSGHTHAGQIRLPGIGAVERKSEIYDEGLRRRPWTQVYTSRGVGTTALPLRFGARPEVAIIELTGAPRPPLG
jgi:uncharacterized protein